ncbi:hypothetical protein SHKM778_19010 [Streptomyces sp. KM77-8]|uniref:Glycosyltransferase family 1 protein n=1 Tax=Streptomyces haneummycinicus TaxID=3074435 RepID=A0AAT9HDP5_9ACTN
MKIGYSFWGFLGNGVTDTPDGGRSHRRPFIDALLARGHDIVFLQADRDRLEAGDDLGDAYTFDDGTPAIDALFLEWRWAIPGRNTTMCGSEGHTCDLHRQAQLINHYTVRHQVPTVIWDKDRTLRAESVWRRTAHTRVCEAALAPTPGAHSLLFPVAEDLLARADPSPSRLGLGISRSDTWATSTTGTSPSTASSPRPPPASSTWPPGSGRRPAAGRTSASWAGSRSRPPPASTAGPWPRCSCCPSGTPPSGR